MNVFAKALINCLANIIIDERSRAAYFYNQILLQFIIES